MMSIAADVGTGLCIVNVGMLYPSGWTGGTVIDAYRGCTGRDALLVVVASDVSAGAVTITVGIGCVVDELPDVRE